MIGSIIANIKTLLNIAATANSILCSCHVLLTKQRCAATRCKTRLRHPTFHFDELDHIRLIVRAHQSPSQKCSQQHPPLGRQSIHPGSIRGSKGVGAVQGQKGREEGGKLHRVAVQGHDNALQHTNSSLVGCADALLVFTACTDNSISSWMATYPGGLGVRRGGWGCFQGVGEDPIPSLSNPMKSSV